MRHDRKIYAHMEHKYMHTCRGQQYTSLASLACETTYMQLLQTNHNGVERRYHRDGCVEERISQQRRQGD